ncbi:MAG TPA: hypothetical protein PLT66_05710 [Bacillota bacterium]|nr:hypothetical protein [Bacillota bacterium]
MKNEIAVFLAVVLLLCFVSCDDAPSEQSTPVGSTSKTETSGTALTSEPETSEDETSIPFVSDYPDDGYCCCLHGWAQDYETGFHVIGLPFYSDTNKNTGICFPLEQYLEWCNAPQKDEYVRPCLASDKDYILAEVQHNIAEFIREFDVDKEKNKTLLLYHLLLFCRILRS